MIILNDYHKGGLRVFFSPSQIKFQKSKMFSPVHTLKIIP